MKLSRYKPHIAIISFAVFLFFTGLNAYAAQSTSDDPTRGWQISTPEAQGMRSQVLSEMMEHIHRKSLNIDSITIVRNGRIVLDAYFWPFSKEDKHSIHSCTKSVMSALIGIAIHNGYIQDVNQPITDFFPDKAFANMDDLKRSITLEDLLMMASGFKCEDSWRYFWKGLIEMHYSPDWAQYVLDLPMARRPGETFEYCNGVSYLLSVIIQNTTKMRTLDFTRMHLFDPLGIQDIGWDTSPQGIDIGYGQMRLTPHDMAKFGWLYLNRGRWGKRQVIPPAWVDVSTKRHLDARPFDHYGYQWWVDSKNYYMAVGYKGQRIFVVPDKNMVAVFTGDLSGKESLASKKLLDTYVIPSASSTEPLPMDSESGARLKAQVSQVATEQTGGMIWISEKEGVAKDGVFTRTATPAFSFTYPFGCKKKGIEYPGQIMRMKNLSDVEFSAFIGDIPYGVKLEDFGPKTYAKRLENVGSNINVILNEEITLTCGTKAYRTDIKWMLKEYLPLTTLLVTAYRDGKFVFLSAHPSQNPYLLEPVVQSLNFK